MIRSVLQIIGNHVVGHEDGAILALIKDAVINPDTGKIEAFWVKPLNIPIKNAILSTDSIIEWKKNIYINDERELAEADEIIKISEILTRNTFFIGNTVINESEEVLGKVIDVDFDTNKLYLKNIYVEKTFLGIIKYQSRIFSYDSIIKVMPEYILVKDMEDKKVRVKERALSKEEQPLLNV
jgi:sporulation protein YlmC with PRC-barrel domain